MASRYARRSFRQFARQLKVYQQSPGQYTDDGFVPGAVTSKLVDAVGQPLSEAIAARVLPEGARVSGGFEFYVNADANIAPLRTGDFPTGRDILQFEGVLYRTVAVQPWYHDHMVVVGERLDTQVAPVEGMSGTVLSGGDEALSESGDNSVLS